MVDKALYPFKNNYEKIGAFRYHFIDEGAGDPVIMVHGNPTWSFYFRNLVQALKFDHRTIVPDHLGCGLSDKPTAEEYGFTLEDRVRDFEIFIDRLKLSQKLTLILHDWGGMIGMAYAVRHPERIGRLIILNTAAFHMPEKKVFPWQLKLCRNATLGPLMVQGLNAFSRAAVNTCCTRRAMPKTIRNAYLSPYNNWNNRLAVLKFVEDIPLKKGDQSYDLVSCTEKGLHYFKDIPMLICWGGKDFVFDEHFLNKWIEYFPKAQVHRFADVGHYILEDAWEEVFPLIRRFLEQHVLEN